MCVFCKLKYVQPFYKVLIPSENSNDKSNLSNNKKQ